MEHYTKDYLFALLISGNEEEKNRALKELCNRYKEISYYQIKKFVEQHKTTITTEVKDE